MDAPSYTGRDEPQDEHEAVQRLRAELRRMTDLAEQLLDGAAPRRGRSSDDREAWALWQEDAQAALCRAREAFEQTAVFSDTQRAG
jgi:ElaB/YqjD/DUF883 family membrane-anchored ribosome-binding protein